MCARMQQQKISLSGEGVKTSGLYRVIYNAIEDVEAAMKGMLDPVFEEENPRPRRGTADI